MPEEKIKLKKTLYIGLGGTGVSTILKIKKCFIDIYNEVPPMIGFLALDTDSSANNKEEKSNRGSHIRLEPNEILVTTVREALATYRNSPEFYDWVPSKNVRNLINIAGFGAGQVRSNGRFIAFYNNEKIKNNIQSALNRLHRNLPENSPYYVDRNREEIEYPTTINVFGSIAGGTGSGMLIDVLCLIKDAVNQIGQPATIYPWIILPEIFKAMGTGPAMANVLYNTYGALRSLDYIRHLDPNDNAINFGYTKISEPIFDYAFIINNYSQAGVSFTKINDLLDSVAKSAFLPANKMGDEIISPFDNIRHQQDAHTYDILNKIAWAASTGSAELVYDSHAMGRAYADKLISLICSSMTQTQSDGTELANKFFDDPKVLIRENLGRDDVIDYLLKPTPDYPLTVDVNTSETDILFYIDQNTKEDIDETLSFNYKSKLENTEKFFNQYISNILDNTITGCVGEALQFVRSVKNLITLCKGEMLEEEEDFRNKNKILISWSSELNIIKNSGINSLFGGKINEDRLEIFQQKLSEFISNIREEKRRTWAIRFYNSFDAIVDKIKSQLDSLCSYLVTIHDKFANELQKEQNLAESTSQFQIFLHKRNIYAVSSYDLNDSIKNDFHNYFKNNGGLKEWLGISLKNITTRLYDYVKTTSVVQEALNVDINDVLRSMSQEQVEEYIEKLKILSSPLWTYNTQGYNTKGLKMDKFVIVGVEDRNTSILSTNLDYSKLFDTNTHSASFASTHQRDRVYVLTVEDLLPIYAVNNFNAYKRDFEDKINQNYGMAAYIDEKLNNRIKSENFEILPTKEQDNILELWVLGFIFDYIHYDEITGKYWMRSRNRGSAIRNFRFDLSSQRDVAYDTFKSESLYKELEESLNKEIAKNGKDKIDNKISSIKQEGTYYEKYSQISPMEKSNIETPNFHAVLDLITKEIELMTE